MAVSIFQYFIFEIQNVTVWSVFINPVTCFLVIYFMISVFNGCELATAIDPYT